LRAIFGPNVSTQRRTVSKLTSKPLSASRSSISRLHNVNRRCSQTECWMMAGGNSWRVYEFEDIEGCYQRARQSARFLEQGHLTE
jgi:hypothetical protein